LPLADPELGEPGTERRRCDAEMCGVKSSSPRIKALGVQIAVTIEVSA
jgi:hypothetical protein